MTIKGREMADGLASVLPTSASGDSDKVKDTILRRTYVWDGNDNATAATNIAEGFIWQNRTGITMKVVSVTIASHQAVTAHASNYASGVVKQYYSNGTAVGNVAVVSTSPVANGGTGNLTAHLPTAANTSLANQEVPNGYFLTGQIVKEGTGVQLSSAATPQAGTTKLIVVVEPV